VACEMHDALHKLLDLLHCLQVGLLINRSSAGGSTHA